MSHLDKLKSEDEEQYKPPLDELTVFASIRILIREELEELSKKETDARKALDIYADDPHQFSTRPCTTCKNISILLGVEWGCIKVRNKK